MSYFKKLMLNMVLLFVLLITIELASARAPLWVSEPRLKAYGRRLTADDGRNHHYHNHP
ncbi:unnamed protein product [Trifolium pratense]|uniref:Uncharacterized protein n=1 Tax=Trifolium pratense TaxID=57577 RepID=A0ACB0J4B9_TRIPR|nr:unnamed protein product [Trifolium pratense]